MLPPGAGPARSDAAGSPAARAPAAERDQRLGGRRRRASSAQTACPRDACATAATRQRARRPPRQARWKPPIPLTATIAPARSAAAARPQRDLQAQPAHRPRRAATPTARTPDRRSAGHGSAGRPDPRTRRRQRSHIGKAAIVVSGRSYGTPRTIVNRGPQLVQLMNG